MNEEQIKRELGGIGFLAVIIVVLVGFLCIKDAGWLQEPMSNFIRGLKAATSPSNFKTLPRIVSLSPSDVECLDQRIHQRKHPRIQDSLIARQ